MPNTARRGYVNAPLGSSYDDPTAGWAALAGTMASGSVASITVDDTSRFHQTLRFNVEIGLRDTDTGIYSNREVLEAYVTSGTTLAIVTRSDNARSHAIGESLVQVWTVDDAANNPGPLTTTGSIPYLASSGAMAELLAPANGNYALNFASGIPSYVSAPTWATLATPPTSTPLGSDAQPFSDVISNHLKLITVAAPGTYTLANSGIVMVNGAGDEVFRIWGTDPDQPNDWNSANLYIGTRAGFSQPAANDSGSGYQNVGIGYESLYSSTSAVDNNGLGTFALRSLTSGSTNSAFGSFSLYSLETGDNNIGEGYSTLFSLVSGGDNVAIGAAAGYSALGSRNVFIGRSAGGNWTGSDALFIDVTDTSTPLIGGDFSARTVSISGTVTATDFRAKEWYIPTPSGGTTGVIKDSPGAQGLLITDVDGLGNAWNIEGAIWVVQRGFDNSNPTHQYLGFESGTDGSESVVYSRSGPLKLQGDDGGGITSLKFDPTQITLHGPTVSDSTITATDFIVSGSRFKSDTTDAHTGGLAVYDVNATTYRDWCVWTNGNSPAVVISIPTTGTLSIDASTLTVNSVAVATASSATAFTNKTGAISQWTNDASYTTLAAVSGVGYLTSVTAHNLLSTTHGDTLTDSVVRGDLLYGNSTPKWARLAKPSVLSGLSHDGTDVSWVTATGTGAPVRASSPTLTTPALGTPSALVLTNATGLPVNVDFGFTAGQTITAPAGSKALTLAGGTQTTSFPALDIAQTWNASGTTFTAVNVNVTSTASATASLLQDWQVAGTSVLKVGKTGIVTSTANGSGAYLIAVSGQPVVGIGRNSSVNGVDFFGSDIAQPIMNVGGGAGNTTSATVLVTSTTKIGWASSAVTQPIDAFFMRGGAAATIQMGVNVNGAPVTQNFGSHKGITGTDVAGATMNFYAGPGTGAAAASSITFQTPTVTTTGTTQQVLATRFTIGSTVLTVADAVDIAMGTTTGTKHGTATSQKQSFWNATPIVQPTTGIAAATFAANTSAIANDSATWDSYTIGQVVKALRNVGLLA